ncbi:hypothetical protein [Sphingobacterium psychroaquaticum]|uniref:HNH endonuclease n=1 Tax=Sphingobacterium psychroaquaticum TaxID=561061 RepID=A0A1X7JW83_9SPHI|nr:hypothetical protein [Sphingobacterium psychroaquaticum]SMG32518.1 hypothetical protein SAMN05660862_2261 [Sphingobacterium psychroaquaticum]
MTRTPDEIVKKELRKESKFICSLPDCYSPFLEYHHFDPPWHIENHHNPSGMISLCPQHHREADAGVWTNEQLRKMKNDNINNEDLSIVEGKLNYLRNKFLLKAGGNYYYNNTLYDVVLKGRPLIWFNINDEGLKMLNVELFNSQGDVYFKIVDNSWDVNNNVKDVICPPSGKKLRVNFDNGDYFKLEFKEIDTLEKLNYEISNLYINEMRQEIPFTILKCSLKLKEFNLNFQEHKSFASGIMLSNCFMLDCRVGVAL